MVNQVFVVDWLPNKGNTARALTAGFLQAASQLFNVQSIPTISIKRDGDSSDATPYQQVMSSDALGAQQFLA